MEDERIDLAHIYHKRSHDREAEADSYRKKRDDLIRALRADDPKQWTYQKLADEIGCSMELIAFTVKRDLNN